MGITDLSDILTSLPEKKIQVALMAMVFLLQYSFEHLVPENRKYNNVKNELGNVLAGAINLLVLLAPSYLLVSLILFTEKNRVGLLHVMQLPFIVNLMITIVVMDLVMYWWHRCNHLIGFFWRFHKFHHLDKHMNTTTALRFHTVELLFSTLLKSLVFVVMGYSFIPVIIYETLFFTAIVIHHSNIKISAGFDARYRRLFSSPLMHRIHHSNRMAETNSNYGSVFSFWDRLFGSYTKVAKEEIIFGVDEKMG